jgi:antitoxin ParD1/3/4
MNVSIGTHWEQFVDGLVKSGRYGSASEVVREGLRQVEARETKLKALKDTIEASIAEGGSYTWDEVMEDVEAGLDEVEAKSQAAEALSPQSNSPT